MASRRRRRQSIGKVVTSIENKVRRLEKRPGAKKLKNNVVTTEKIQYRAIKTKTIEADAVTPNETSFGTTVVTNTEPTTYLKEGTTWVNPTDGATAVYSTDLEAFVTVTDAAAQAAAEGKNSVFRQDDAPSGGTYVDGDLWIDTNDGNKMYVWNGTTWVSAQDASIATAQSTANGKNKVYYSTSDPGSTANTAGDIWFKYSGGVIIAQYSGAGGTTWNSTTIGNAVIANLDAGKITTGFLSVAGTVKIGTSTTGARVELSPSGFFAYNGSNNATVSILAADGSATFTGNVTSSNVSSSNIVGGTLKTSSTGQRIELTSAASNYIYFYGSSTSPGTISVNGHAMYLYSPASDPLAGAQFVIYGDQDAGGNAGKAAILAKSTGSILLSTTTNSLTVRGDNTAVQLSTSTPVDGFGLRNIKAYSSTDIFNPATSSVGGIGDIILVYTA